MSQLNQTISIQTEANTQPFAQLQRRMLGVENAFNRAARAGGNNEAALNRANNSAKKFSDQGLANIQAGLVQLSTYALNVSVAFDNMFEKAQNRYKNVDTALTQLRITMGMTGANSIEQASASKALMAEYKDLESFISKLAMTTQFTAVETANLATEFRRAGRSVAETKSMTQLALRLTAASAGTVTLAEAGNLLLNTMSATKRAPDDLAESMDRLLYSSQNLRMSVPDMVEGYKSLSGALNNFSDDAKEADSFLYTMLAGYKELGKSPREATDAIRQSSKAISDLYSALNRAELRGMDKAYTRISEKREALLMAMGLTPDNKDVIKRAKALGSSINYARDIMGQELVTGKDGQLIGIREFISLLKTMQINLRATGGEARSLAILKKAFGVGALTDFTRAMEAVERSTKKSVTEIMDDINGSIGNVTSAADESLKTLDARLQLLASAEDALSNAIFQHDIVAKGAVGTYTDLVSGMVEVINLSPSLGEGLASMGRAAQFVSKAVTQLGFALVAAATFSIGLRYAGVQLGGGILSLGRIFGSFYTVFLAPTLAVLLSLTGAALMLGAGFSELFKKISGAKTIGEGFQKTIDGLSVRFKNVTGHIKAFLSGMTLTEDVLKDHLEISSKVDELNKKKSDLVIQLAGEKDIKRAKDLKAQILGLNRQVIELERTGSRQSFLKTYGVEALDSLKTMNEGQRKSIFELGQMFTNTWRNLSAFIEGASAPMANALMMLLDIAHLLLAPIEFIGRVFGLISEKSDELAGRLKVVGQILGTYFGAKIILGGLGAVVGTFLSIRQKIYGMGAAAVSFNNELKTMNALVPGMTPQQRALQVLRASWDLVTKGVAATTAQYRAMNAVMIQNNQLLAQQQATATAQAALSSVESRPPTPLNAPTYQAPTMATPNLQPEPARPATVTPQQVMAARNGGAPVVAPSARPVLAQFNGDREAFAQARAAHAEQVAQYRQMEAQATLDAQRVNDQRQRQYEERRRQAIAHNQQERERVRAHNQQVRQEARQAHVQEVADTRAHNQRLNAEHRQRVAQHRQAVVNAPTEALAAYNDQLRTSVAAQNGIIDRSANRIAGAMTRTVGIIGIVGTVLPEVLSGVGVSMDGLTGSFMKGVQVVSSLAMVLSFLPATIMASVVKMGLLLLPVLAIGAAAYGIYRLIKSSSDSAEGASTPTFTKTSSMSGAPNVPSTPSLPSGSTSFTPKAAPSGGVQNVENKTFSLQNLNVNVNSGDPDEIARNVVPHIERRLAQQDFAAIS